MMKTPCLALAFVSLASSSMSQDIVEEALKVTPAGFTDLVPRSFKSEAITIERSAGSMTIHPDFERVIYTPHPIAFDLQDISNGGDSWDGLDRYHDLMKGPPYRQLMEWPAIKIPLFPELEHLPNPLDFGIPVKPDEDQFNDVTPKWKFPPLDLIPLFLESA